MPIVDRRGLREPADQWAELPYLIESSVGRSTNERGGVGRKVSCFFNDIAWNYTISERFRIFDRDTK